MDYEYEEQKMIEDDELLKNYIWNKVSQSIKKELDSKPIYNKKNSENQYKILHCWSSIIMKT